MPNGVKIYSHNLYMYIYIYVSDNTVIEYSAKVICFEGGAGQGDKGQGDKGTRWHADKGTRGQGDNRDKGLTE